MKKKLAYFVQFPIHYQAPLLTRLSDSVDLKVFFLSDLTTRSFRDKGFGTIKWDADLTGGYDHAFLSSWYDSGGFSFWNPVVRGLGKALSERSWDAVWFHGYAHWAMPVAMNKAFRRGIPVFFRGESNLVCTPPDPIRDALVRWIIRKSSALLCIGKMNRDFYLHHGASPEQLFDVPYAVDNDALQAGVRKAAPEGARLRRELGIPEECPVVLYASKLMERKNPVLLLEAFAGLPRQEGRPPGVLVYVGNGEQFDEVKRRAVELSVDKWVHMVGFRNQSELPAWFALADVFALPSYKEPFGMVVNEAMNAGLPVIASDEVGAAVDLVQNGNNGFLVKAGSLPDLQKALAEALGDRERLRRMGRAGLERINHWSYDQDILGILAALEAAGGPANKGGRGSVRP